MVVIILRLNSRADCRYLPALGMAYAYSSFSVYRLCKRHEYNVTS